MLPIMAGALAAAASWTLVLPQARAQSIELVMQEQARADEAAAASQARITKLHDATQEKLARYRQALSEAESYEKYNEQVATQVASQVEEIATIERQLAGIEATARDVLPLMVKMVDTLDKLVALDLPFLPDERRSRIASLRQMLPRADVSISEKYRRILEAYQIEMEYGRTLGAYDGTLEGPSGPRTVELVHLGRVALMYRTLDGKEAGYWDAGAKAWVRDPAAARAVREVLRVAKKQGAPDLVTVPVPAPRKVAP